MDTTIAGAGDICWVMKEALLDSPAGHYVSSAGS